MKRKYGWKPQRPDHRDFLFAERHTLKLTNLPPSVSLRAKMPPVFDQGELGSCHDAETEILTDRGWVKFPELNGDERLATVNPETRELFFEKPVRFVRMPYKGKLICANNGSLNFKVTPDHKMLVRRWVEAKRTLSDEYIFVAAENLGWYCGLMNRVKWAGERPSDVYVLPGVAHKHLSQREELALPMSTWLEFLGLYLAEGTMIHSDNNHYKIQIAAVKEREKVYVRELFKRIGVNVCERSDRFTFENRRIYTAMEALGLKGVKAPQKSVPDFVFWQSADDIKHFLLGHFMGDGSEQHNRSHYTSSAQLADDLQRLIFLSGQETRLFIREPRNATLGDGRTINGRHPEHRVSVCEKKNISIERRKVLFTEDYDGDVFCAEVPTYHTLVTRRCGKILISGNCSANAGALAYAFERGGGPYSRLQLYWGERLVEGTVDEDSGAMLRDCIKVLVNTGIALEKDWPYVVEKFAVAPPPQILTEAAQNRITEYLALRDRDDYRQCLAAGFPFIVGIQVFEELESEEVAKTGIVPMPSENSQYMGGHAVVITGYTTEFHNDPAFKASGLSPNDYPNDVYECRNSWGAWGYEASGTFFLPAEYLENPELGSDAWTIRG